MNFEDKSLKLAKYIDDLVQSYSASEIEALQSLSENISLQELKVIIKIGRLQKCIMRELAESMMLAMSTMTGIVDKLVRKKFVKRERSEDDRRIVNVELTDKGKEIFNIEIKNHIMLAEAMLKPLSKTEQNILLSLLKKITGKI